MPPLQQLVFIFISTHCVGGGGYSRRAEHLNLNPDSLYVCQVPDSIHLPRGYEPCYNGPSKTPRGLLLSPRRKVCHEFQRIDPSPGVFRLRRETPRTPQGHGTRSGSTCRQSSAIQATPPPYCCTLFRSRLNAPPKQNSPKHPVPCGDRF